MIAMENGASGEGLAEKTKFSCLNCTHPSIIGEIITASSLGISRLKDRKKILASRREIGQNRLTLH